MEVDYLPQVPFSTLQGLTFLSVKQEGDREIIFHSSDGRIFIMGHIQDCCEGVYIESIVGDLSDLVGNPILVAEESVSGEWPDDAAKLEYEPDSYTWTFYKLATIKGHVDIRWYGESSGYYSESVTLHQHVEARPK